jgi:outer membrane lipoprotein carrier protein
MIKKFLCVCALVLSLPSVASEIQNSAAELKARLSELHSFEADFEQQVTDLQGELLQTATGKLQLQQPNKMRWQLYEPDETTLIADGDTVWHIDPFMEQVIAYQQSQAVQGNPLILLAEPDSDHWQSFQISQPETGRFVIKSQSEDSQIASLSLTFKDDVLVQLTFEDRQQQRTQMAFSQIASNIALAPELFEFTLPEGYELDDQR